MKKRYSTFILLCLCAFAASAQTLEEAKKMFENKEFAQAKGTFQKYVKTAPTNPSYNFWYGACCYETGETKIAEKHLNLAASKKIQESFRYLGQLYSEEYRYEDALLNYNAYEAMLLKSKKPTDEVEKLIKKVTQSAQMIKGVEQVAIIDSVIVDKKGFLNAYKINEESGHISTFKSFFETENEHDGIVFQTELGNKIYYADCDKKNILNIYTKTKLMDQWSEASLLPKSINTGEDTNYPFILSDGITIYYASKGENSMGGYDIFVTRYNSDTDTYLTPENVGMPFNSPFNDYMYVIDEYNNLGWFASDRYQPKDKVCIYTFIPNESKHIYDLEKTDEKKLISLAKISSLKDTWKGKAVEIKEAKERLAQAKSYQPTKEEKNDFVFVINDQLTYKNTEEFTAPKAIELLKLWKQTVNDYATQSKKLEKQRDAFTEANQSKKEAIALGIADLEKRVEQMEEKTKSLEIQIRNEENNWLRK